MQVCIAGAGYVGLVSGACFAETGHQVVCMDIDERRIAQLTRGKVPIFEPGLEELVERNVRDGRLRFSSDAKASIGGSQVVCVAVGTPPQPDGSVELRYVDAVAQAVRDYAEQPTVLMLKSTVPVGTNARIRRIVSEAKSPIRVVSNPEFLKEGDAVRDFMHPERVVIGCDQDHDIKRLVRRLYHPFTLQGERIMWMDPASAELTKYVANTMLAMRISMMNEIATLCERVGANVHRVREAVGKDSRIGNRFLHAGPGFGGSCFPKDVRALVHSAREAGVALELARHTAEVNDRHKAELVKRLHRLCGRNLRGQRVALWGLAFKPRTDDVRESPALTLAQHLVEMGAHVAVHDPVAMRAAADTLGDDVEYCESAYDAAQGADALALLTEWRQYQSPDFERLRQCMRTPCLLDTRNIWSTYEPQTMGFRYAGIGVPGSA